MEYQTSERRSCRIVLYSCIIFATDIEVCNRRRISTSVTTTSMKVQAQYYRCHQYYGTITTKVFVCPTVCSSHLLVLVLYYTKLTNNSLYMTIYNKQILDVMAVFLFLFFSCVRMWSSPLPYDDVG